MRILIAGAGAVGGYFGGRLVQSGADITFLVRERRARQLEKSGLVIRSSFGDFVSQVPFIRWTDPCDAFDVAILCCKAFDLVETAKVIKPRLTSNGIVLPLLNGIAHLQYLDVQLPAATIVGGTCHMGVTLNSEGDVIHLNPLHSLTYGARTASRQQACELLAEIFQRVSFPVKRSDHIEQDMWQKWMFLTTLASVTCLMRNNIGAIAATQQGIETIQSLFNETCSIATAEGFAPSPAFMQEAIMQLTDPASQMTSSMLRDLEKGSAIEADHIVADMIRRGQRHGIPTPLLNVALTHLLVYERNRHA